jgi:ABC-type glycerol-3-phosphate transport system substrate-binding protein
MANQVNRRSYPTFPIYCWAAILFLILFSACQAAPAPSLTGTLSSTGSPSPSQEKLLPSFTPFLPDPSAKATTSPTTPTTPTSKPDPVSSLQIQPAELKGITIQFWHVWPGASNETLNKLVEEFNASNEWGIRVEPTSQGNFDTMSEQVNAAIQEKRLPDIVMGYPYQAQAWDQDGQAVVNLEDYVNDPAWGLSQEEQSDFYPVFWQQDLAGEKRLGIPAQRTAQVIYYNQTWAKELGFQQPPATPEEFKKQACAAAQANNGGKPAPPTPDPNHTGGWIISTNYSAIAGWIEAFGGEISTSSGYHLGTPQVESAFTFLRGLYDQGCAWLSKSDPPTGEFADRQGLFATESITSIPYQAAEFKQAANQDEWAVLPFPGTAGKPAINVYGSSYQILKSQPARQLAAWLFIKWLTSPENQSQLSRSSGYFPTRASARQRLALDSSGTLQWAASLELIQYVRPEPSFQSWSTVRWALSDAATQLFRYYFTIDQVPSLVKLLDQTANDLNSGGQ